MAGAAAGGRDDDKLDNDKLDNTVNIDLADYDCYSIPRRYCQKCCEFLRPIKIESYHDIAPHGDICVIANDKTRILEATINFCLYNHDLYVYYDNLKMQNTGVETCQNINFTQDAKLSKLWSAIRDNTPPNHPFWNNTIIVLRRWGEEWR